MTQSPPRMIARRPFW